MTQSESQPMSVIDTHVDDRRWTMHVLLSLNPGGPKMLRPPACRRAQPFGCFRCPETRPFFAAAQRRGAVGTVASAGMRRGGWRTSRDAAGKSGGLVRGRSPKTMICRCSRDEYSGFRDVPRSSPMSFFLKWVHSDEHITWKWATTCL